MNKSIRQGDVMLIPVEKIPAKLKKSKDNILAHGEATGHAHVLYEGTVYVGEDGKMFVKSGAQTVLKHQTREGVIADHQPLEIPAGEWEVRIEEEYTPEEIRRVED